MVYKITNITNTFDKKDSNYNKVLNIKYNKGFLSVTDALKPGEFKYFIVDGNSLPRSIQNFKIKNLIVVEEISNSRLEYEKKKKEKNKPVVSFEEKTVIKKKNIKKIE